MKRLYATFGGAIAWVLHFLGSYAAVTVGCGYKWPGMGLIVGLGTGLFGLMAAGAALAGWSEWRRLSAGQPLGDALLEARSAVAWLMLVGLLIGSLAAFTILLQGAGATLLPMCDAHGH